MDANKHSLNARVDLAAYREYTFVVDQEVSSVNSYTEKLIKAEVKRWKKNNPGVEIPENYVSKRSKK